MLGLLYFYVHRKETNVDGAKQMSCELIKDFDHPIWTLHELYVFVSNMY